MRYVAAIVIGLMLLYQGWCTASYALDLLWTVSVYTGLYAPFPMSMSDEAALFFTYEYGLVMSIELLFQTGLRGAAVLLLALAIVGIVLARRPIAGIGTGLALLAHLASHALAFGMSMVYGRPAETEAFLMRWEGLLGELAWTVLDLWFAVDLLQALIVLVVGGILIGVAMVGAAPSIEPDPA